LEFMTNQSAECCWLNLGGGKEGNVLLAEKRTQAESHTNRYVGKGKRTCEVFTLQTTNYMYRSFLYASHPQFLNLT
jgi:hypothetical protein